MHETIERLLYGDNAVVGYFAKTMAKWNELFEGHAEDDVTAWAEWLGKTQIPFFEAQCGGRSYGQEVMAWSGFGTLYGQAGFTPEKKARAVKLVKAFDGSTCSIEVKGKAKGAARFYDLDEVEELKEHLRSP